MKNTIKNEHGAAYTAPEVEILALDECDVISTSGAGNGFFGEEHNLKGSYDWYEWE